MTVSRVDGDQAECTWLDGKGKQQVGAFPVDGLQKIPPNAPLPSKKLPRTRTMGLG